MYQLNDRINGLNHKAIHRAATDHPTDSPCPHLGLDAAWAPVLERGYSPTEVLGSGSYGQVVKAKCHQTKKTVSIKMIKLKKGNAYAHL